MEPRHLFTMLSRMDNASADGALSGLSHALNRIEAQRRLSLTYNKGREMAAMAGGYSMLSPRVSRRLQYEIVFFWRRFYASPPTPSGNKLQSFWYSTRSSLDLGVK